MHRVTVLPCAVISLVYVIVEVQRGHQTEWESSVHSVMFGRNLEGLLHREMTCAKSRVQHKSSSFQYLAGASEKGCET